MSFSARLIHELTVSRPSVADADVVDDYGQPVRGTPTTLVFRGLPQPKTIAEVVATSQGGAVVGKWTIFTQIIEIVEADRIIHDAVTCPVPSVRDLPTGYFEPTGIRQAAGIGHHLEIDAEMTAGVPA